MSLQEKVEAAASEADGDPEAAASKLKESMTAKEKQSVWSKHQTWSQQRKGGRPGPTLWHHIRISSSVWAYNRFGDMLTHSRCLCGTPVYFTT